MHGYGMGLAPSPMFTHFYSPYAYLYTIVWIALVALLFYPLQTIFGRNKLSFYDYCQQLLPWYMGVCGVLLILFIVRYFLFVA